MSKLSYRTLADERPQGKPNVYFSCHPDDFGQYFEEYATKILKIQDCAIWYKSEPEAGFHKEELELFLPMMQLIVMPVTTKLLFEACHAIEEELPLAMEKHIPVLPLMMEQGLDDGFVMHFGDLQYLDPNDRDETRRSFDEMLGTYVKSVLFSQKLAEKVRSAFDGYIFLSYRKKDRRKAQELMRMIHRSPLCRDIAIWYDEFLTPGEDFNDAIGKMLEKSNLFVLVVTPNLVNEANYVMTKEYPAAIDLKKPILPIEMEETDRGKLEEHYKSLPPCIPGEENIVFHAEILKKIMTLAISSNDEDPEHNYLIGLAYLDGIDVEIDTERALELITSAAEDGVPEAMMQLAVMYETGKGVIRDYREGIKWREKHVQYLKKEFEIIPSEKRAVNLICRIWDLGDAQYALRNLNAAEESYNEMCSLAMRFTEPDKHLFRRLLAAGFSKLGKIAADKGDLEEAQKKYEMCFVIFLRLAEKTGADESWRELAISYEKLGDITKAKGEHVRSQSFYEKSFTIREELSAKTGTIQSRLELSHSYFKLGGIAAAKGDLEGAQRYYEKGLIVCKELAEKTDNAKSKQDLSAFYIILGDVIKAKGDNSTAQKYYEKALDICDELSEKTGTIPAYRNLAKKYFNLGVFYFNKGSRDKARVIFSRIEELGKRHSDKYMKDLAKKAIFILVKYF